MGGRGHTVLAPLLCIAAGSLLRAQSGPKIAIDKVMTTDELRATGVDTLSPPQRAALDRWLSEYSLTLFQVAQRPGAPGLSAQGPLASAYSGGSEGHWIQSNTRGAIITLEDGSMWEINSFDRLDTALWLPVSNIKILTAASPIGDYKYILFNTDDKEKAQAKYLGKQ